MGIVIYNNEAEMPHYLRKEKQEGWNILDRMDWDEWNFVPTTSPQKSKFNNHVTWNSHRTDYFNKMNIKIAEEKAANTRIAIDNKIGTTASYNKEMAEALAEEKKWEEEEAFEALQKELAASEYTNTVLLTPEPYVGFVKQTDAERAAKRKIQNRKTYLRRKEEGTNIQVNKDATYEFCDFCGGEHKDTPQGRNNHKLSQIHATKVLTNNICNYLIKKNSNIKTMEQAERVLANKIKESEKSLCITYTPTTLKNKYKRLWAQYSSS